MTKDLKTMPDEEVKACWNLHYALAEAAYKRLREISAEEADYNRRRYLELARTPEGLQEYREQIASFRAAEVTPRQAHRDASDVCTACHTELQRRGLM